MITKLRLDIMAGKMEIKELESQKLRARIKAAESKTKTYADKLKMPPTQSTSRPPALEAAKGDTKPAELLDVSPALIKAIQIIVTQAIQASTSHSR